MVKGKKPRPESYFRYREQNPTVSFCLDRELKELIDKDRGEKSYGEYVKELIQHGLSEVKRLSSEVDQLRKEIDALKKEQIAQGAAFVASRFRRGQPRARVARSKKSILPVQPYLLTHPTRAAKPLSHRRRGQRPRTA